MTRKLTPSDTVILISAAVMTLGSFLPFWDLDLPAGFASFAAETGFGDKRAWTSELFFFPVTILPVLCGLLMAVPVLLDTFTGVTLPRRPAGFTWTQIHVVLGLQAAIMMIAFLVQERGFYKLGIGFYLMLVAGLGLAIGALMRDREPS
jgi:hypothetical protein